MLNQKEWYGVTGDEWTRFFAYMGTSIPFVAQEECGELIQAISKMYRAILNGKKLPKDNLLEEIADVFIAIFLICGQFGISDDDVTNEIIRKMERNIKRMEGG